MRAKWEAINYERRRQAGILNSYGDSVPLLFFAGVNRRFEVPRRGQKELAIHEVFRSVTNWTTTMIDTGQIDDITPVMEAARG